jgi:hypothetical protein
MIPQNKMDKKKNEEDFIFFFKLGFWYISLSTHLLIFHCYGFHCPIYDKSQHVLLERCKQKKIATYKSQKIMVSNFKII